MSQQELAARAGLRREKLNRIENKGENLGFAEMCRLLDAAGLELDVREKGSADLSVGMSASASEQIPHLLPQEFNKAAFVRGSKAKILDWGKVSR